MKLRLGTGAYQPTALVVGFVLLTWRQRALELSQAADNREHDVEINPPAEGLGHALGHAVERAHSLHVRAERDAPIVHVRREHHLWGSGEDVVVSTCMLRLYTCGASTTKGTRDIALRKRALHVSK